MIVLGIDSSTDHLGLGLAFDGDRHLESHVDSVQEHATNIIDAIDRLLTRAEVAKERLGGIAVADGPGSFTGLRIGMAAAKGMALALKIPIVGISTFEVIARRLIPRYEQFWLAAMARKGEFYICRVSRNIDVRKSIELISLADLHRKIASDPVGIIGRKPEEWQQLDLQQISMEETAISGGELAKYGRELIVGGKTADLASLEPFYIAPSQAERKFGRS